LLRPALIALCAERGYPELSQPQLLARAGVTDAEIDPDLARLEDCFCAVLEIEREEFFAYLDRTIAGATDWRLRLRAAAYALLRHLRADPARAHFLTVEIPRAGERANLIWSETILAPLLDLIDEGRAVANSKRVSRATATAVAGAVISRINLGAGGGFDQAERSIVPPLLSIAVLPYLGAEAAAAELHAPPPPDPAARLPRPERGGGEQRHVPSGSQFRP
jgi:hypothetical protein